jgi:hypothetical protein
MSSGPLARTVRDAAGVLDAISGYVTGDPYWAPDPQRSLVEEAGRDPGRLRVGVVTISPLGEVHTDCVAAVEDAAALLEELGHFVSPTSLELSEDFVSDFQAVWFASLAATQVPDWSKTERKTQQQAELGCAIHAPDYLRAISALLCASRVVLSRCGKITTCFSRPRWQDLRSGSAPRKTSPRSRWSRSVLDSPRLPPSSTLRDSRPSPCPFGGTAKGYQSGCS